ncbi:MAG: RnfABCDGE type electron transport complex subunit D [Clostridia bacterium]|nr:RnfABCDGE type electron transport complex subunit D [Clostridia bacterium]
MKRKDDFSMPLIHSGGSVPSMTGDVFIALAPAFIWGVFAFGARALAVVAVGVAAAVISELLFCLVFRKKQTVGDLSAAVTGFLFSVSLPATVPLWLPALGAFVAVIGCKAAFGGLGRNYVNPAVFVHCVFFFVFPKLMTDFPMAYSAKYVLPESLSFAKLTGVLGGKSGLFRFLTGLFPSAIADGAIVLLGIGGLYLIFRRVISVQIPAAYLVSFAAFELIFGASLSETAFSVCVGGVVFTAFFELTDPVTSPVTLSGKTAYGIFCGILCVVLRRFVGFYEAPYFAAAISGLLAKVFDMIFMPVPCGRGFFSRRKA